MADANPVVHTRSRPPVASAVYCWNGIRRAEVERDPKPPATVRRARVARCPDPLPPSPGTSCGARSAGGVRTTAVPLPESREAALARDLQAAELERRALDRHLPAVDADTRVDRAVGDARAARRRVGEAAASIAAARAAGRAASRPGVAARAVVVEDVRDAEPVQAARAACTRLSAGPPPRPGRRRRRRVAAGLPVAGAHREVDAAQVLGEVDRVVRRASAPPRCA